MTIGEAAQIGGIVAALLGAVGGGRLIERWLDARAGERKKQRAADAETQAQMDARQQSHMDRIERLLRESQEREAELLRQRERDQARMALLMDHLTDVHRYIAGGSQGEPPDWPVALTGV